MATCLSEWKLLRREYDLTYIVRLHADIVIYRLLLHKMGRYVLVLNVLAFRC
jgi:hypothetical protein